MPSVYDNSRSLWLKYYRLNHKYSLGFMAKKLNTTKTSIFHYENYKTTIDDVNFDYITRALEPTFKYDDIYESIYARVQEIIHYYLAKEINRYRGLSLEILEDNSIKNSNAFLLWIIVRYFVAYLNCDNEDFRFCVNLLKDFDFSNPVLHSFYYVIYINAHLDDSDFSFKNTVLEFSICAEKLSNQSDVEKGLRAYFLYNKSLVGDSLLTKQSLLQESAQLFSEAFYDRRYINCLLRKGLIYGLNFRLIECEKEYELCYRFAKKHSYIKDTKIAISNLARVRFYLGKYRWCLENLVYEQTLDERVLLVFILANLVTHNDNETKLLLEKINEEKLTSIDFIIFEFIVGLLNNDESLVTDRGYEYIKSNKHNTIDWCMTLIRVYESRNEREKANRAKCILMDYMLNNLV